MAGSPKKRARKEAAKTFFEQPNAIDLICARIVAAGTLVDVCREFNIHYGAVNAWIEEDDSRRKRYAAALEVREKHGKEHVIRELMGLLKVDVTTAFLPNGELKALESMPEDVRRFISGMEVEELYAGSGKDKIEIGRVRKIKFYDKMRAIELMAKHLKMLVDKVEHSGKVTLEEILEASRG